ncbi:MAG: hypothetical protein LBM98_00615 [Oscillospiraceae bacterium]|nr:hypothetical protein [Oscillospiraceae bacterium]
MNNYEGRTRVLGLDCFARLAMTVRRDGGRWCDRARRGEPPRRFAAPLPRVEFTGEGGFETRPYVRL